MNKILVLLLITLFWANSAYSLKLFGGLIHIDDDLLEAPKTQTQKPWEKKSANSSGTYQKSGGVVNGSASFRSNLDVDVVAGRIKREFRFKTREETVSTRSGKYAVHHNSFRDDVQPGVYYHMGGFIRHPANASTTKEIQVLVERDGRGCQVDFTFRARTDDPKAFGRSLVARAKRAIRR